MAVPSAGRMALIGRGAPAEVAVIARPIWMGPGIAVASAPSPVTCGSGRRIFSCVTKAGRAGIGSVDRRGHGTTYWSGTQIGGTLSPDGNTIYWDNGTSWSR